MNKVRIAGMGIVLTSAWVVWAQQDYFGGAAITGQLILARTTNVFQLAQAPKNLGASRRFSRDEKLKIPPKRFRPPLMPGPSGAAKLGASALGPTLMSTPSLPVITAENTFGFSGLTHYDQRLANSGNQFSVEPPNPSIAVAGGYVLEGVNNAIQIYSISGAPRLPIVLSTNELFGVPAAIDRVTDLNGVYPTDMRVFYDQTIARWFVLQRAQDYDAIGRPLNSSHLYLAVSQTPDPTGVYNIYVMDTTNAQNPGCPCIADYPQIGADQYGFFISMNEYDVNEWPVDSVILAISKAALGNGVAAPATFRFTIPRVTSFDFSIQPAATPPGASYYIASGGLEFFVSSEWVYGPSHLAVWAMYDTATLNNNNPNPVLTRTIVTTLPYYAPLEANQAPGPLPYGSSLAPPGTLPVLDGGDTRVLSTCYSGGRLYVTLGSMVWDEIGRSLVGAAYFILSPTFRNGKLAAPVLREGRVAAKNNHVLFPAIAVNAQGMGAISFTLVGSDYYPSAAFLPIGTFSTGSAIRLAGLGAMPEDGFTAYEQGVARWGDYSTAVIGADGKVWMVAEYIPNAFRTEYANWGTYVWRYTP